jgi:hypothetical protein
MRTTENHQDKTDSKLYNVLTTYRPSYRSCGYGMCICGTIQGWGAWLYGGDSA